ncbi:MULTISPECIES: transposase [unclassified Roseofilum]|uniref:helix-turn-helix domain-containing protein n=1 Tax=unclassified Roseofilum TaxID=2620099 RepID=UPI000E7F05F3|nr:MULTISPECIES: transposase [unclassified Roseofilum]MBP0011418.1 transposase [Roseofilum sp. Belize Diploria]MBP0035953.1 transposase [Roseofilum sp. Belize BBD 4]HBQ99235.1 transposase [Cyanobacteria bacterium UBA11691]
MQAYSVDLREKIVKAHLIENSSIRKVAERFSVSKSLVQKLVKQQKTEGNVEPKRPGKPQLSYLNNEKAKEQVKGLVAEHKDARLAELCELFAQLTGNWVSPTAMWRCLNQLGLSRKKKRGIALKRGQKEYKN